MSTLNVSNITDGTTTVGTSYVVNGSAKAWASVYYSSGTPIASASFNISSLTDAGTGDYDANFTSNMDSSNYGAGAIAIFNTRLAAFESTSASFFNIRVYDISVGATSAADSSSRFAIHGDLA
jgi:hypothetical protein